MAKRALSSNSSAAAPGRARFYRNLYLLVITIVLLSCAFPPLGQFYLAWVALVPWILYTIETRSPLRAFLASMVMGFVIYTANMWWLWKVTGPGMVALCWYMSLYWGIAAVVVRGLFRRLPPDRFDRCITLVAAVPTLFVALELIRGNLWTGIPWLNISHSQVCFLTMCQVADIFGAYGVTFWVVALNTLLALYALLFLGRTKASETAALKVQPPLHSLVAPTTGLAVLLILIFFYGRFRLSQATTYPGPTITVIQSNFPQSNSGTKGASEQQIMDFHIAESQKALQQAQATHSPSDLVVWSETMVPPINRTAVEFLAGSKYGAFLAQSLERITSLAKDFDTAILAGGIYYGGFRELPNGDVLPIDRRNTAYFISPLGQLSDTRYDKIHLVPFGEFIPFKESIPFLYNFFLKLSPYDYDYTLSPGNPDQLTVFTLTQHDNAKPTRFVTPICFEDLDSVLVSRMFRGRERTKRADLFITITNDGWFASPELYQHLSTAQFRCIENRVPAARSVNTGLSGFIDSTGHPHNLVALHTAGFSTAALQLDTRLTIYTQFGDWFPTLCTFAIGLACLWLMYDAARHPLVNPSSTITHAES